MPYFFPSNKSITCKIEDSREEGEVGYLVLNSYDIKLMSRTSSDVQIDKLGLEIELKIGQLSRGYFTL